MPQQSVGATNGVAGSNATALAVQPEQPRAIAIITPAGSIDEWKQSWDLYQRAKAVLTDPKRDVQRWGEGENAQEFLKKSYWRKASNFFGVDVAIVKETEREIDCDPDRCPANCKGRHYEVLIVARAYHQRTGHFQDGDGSCADNERWGASRSISRKQVNAIVACGKRSEEAGEKIRQGIARLTGSAESKLVSLTAAEGSALLDWLYGKSALLQLPRPARNSRHNVRGTAVTRAKNRAISDLIGGGEVSAEEISDPSEIIDGQGGETDEGEPEAGLGASETSNAVPPGEAPARSSGAAPNDGHAPPAPMPKGMLRNVKIAIERAQLDDAQLGELVAAVSAEVDGYATYLVEKLSVPAGNELLRRLRQQKKTDRSQDRP